MNSSTLSKELFCIQTA